MLYEVYIEGRREIIKIDVVQYTRSCALYPTVCQDSPVILNDFLGFDDVNSVIHQRHTETHTQIDSDWSQC